MSWHRLIRREEANAARESPAGALVLHWCCSVFLIFVTWYLSPSDAYRVLANIYSYLFAAFFPTLIGLGMLWLRLRPGSDWSSKVRQHEPRFRAWLSITSALFVVVAGLFIVVVEWIPPSGQEFKNLFRAIPWWVVPTTSCSVLGLGLLWWMGMYWLLPLTNPGLKRLVYKEPQFSQEHDYWVLDYEKVTIMWIHPGDFEMTTPRGSEDGSSIMSARV